MSFCLKEHGLSSVESSDVIEKSSIFISFVAVVPGTFSVPPFQSGTTPLIYIKASRALLQAWICGREHVLDVRDTVPKTLKVLSHNDPPRKSFISILVVCGLPERRERWLVSDFGAHFGTGHTRTWSSPNRGPEADFRSWKRSPSTPWL